MAKLSDDRIKETFQPYLHGEEKLQYWAFGVKQPNIFLIIFLIALAILPGIIAIALLTKNYLIGLTNKRFIVLQIKSMSNAEVKEIKEYGLNEINKLKVETSTGALFTKISIDDSERPFKAKFHRAFSKNNRPHSVAIGEVISTGIGA